MQRATVAASVTGDAPGGCGLGDNADVLACRADWLYHK
jgi:hypothetical protein